MEGERNVLILKAPKCAWKMRWRINLLFQYMEACYLDKTRELSIDDSLNLIDLILRLAERWQELTEELVKKKHTLVQWGSIGGATLRCQFHMDTIRHLVTDWGDGPSQAQLTELWESLWEIYEEISPSEGDAKKAQ